MVVLPGAVDVLACLAQLAATGTLFLASRQRQRLLAALAVLLGLVGMAFWMAGHGLEYGLVYSALMLTMLGWLAVFLNRDWRTLAKIPKPQRALRWPACNRFGRACAQVVLAGPATGLVACLAGLAWAACIPGAPANRIVSGLFVCMVCWALLACWLLGAVRRHRPILAIGTLLILASLVLVQGGSAP